MRRADWLRVAMLSVALLFPGGPAAGDGQVGEVLEGSPFRGRDLFVEKLCSQCHSVWGHGGSLGPEIARAVAGKPLMQLTGEFWNHTPRMIDETSARGYAWPTLERGEMADLLSYLYYLRLFDEPGRAARGAAAVSRYRCESCHALGGEGGTVAGPLDRFSIYTSPLPLAQAMWNAGPAMRRSQVGRHIDIPEFSGVEMADIQAYIHERGRRDEGQRTLLLPLPDPVAGARVFHENSCATCHASGRYGAPDLRAGALRMTATEISGILWNHSYAMNERMVQARIPFPRFENNELADLISYLHLIGYAGASGNADRGRRLFDEQGCGGCHEDQRVAAPDLRQSAARVDAIALAAAMWNHAPQMHAVMVEQEAFWPKFEEGDLEDLAAYLGSLGSRTTP